MLLTQINTILELNIGYEFEDICEKYLTVVGKLIQESLDKQKLSDFDLFLTEKVHILSNVLRYNLSKSSVESLSTMKKYEVSKQVQENSSVLGGLFFVENTMHFVKSACLQDQQIFRRIAKDLLSATLETLKPVITEDIEVTSLVCEQIKFIHFL